MAFRSLLLLTCLLRAAGTTPQRAALDNHPETEGPRRHPACFDMERVRCLLDPRDCPDGRGRDEFPSVGTEVLLGRVRFPGTASVHEMSMFKTYEDDQPRFESLYNFSSCPSAANLCFTPNEGVDLALAFRPLQHRDSAHSPYDIVVSRMLRRVDMTARQHPTTAPGVIRDALKEYFLLTTLRDPGPYALKWYKSRTSWDKTIDLADSSFVEWIDLAPWRMNMLTRNLGAKPDRKAAPASMLHSGEGKIHGSGVDVGTFLEDAYMKEQNQLGPEGSEVYQLALDRLRNEFVHFGLFHRLEDSWQLLAHNLCWHIKENWVKDGQHLRGLDAMRGFFKDESAANEAWSRLWERNRLDIALMEAADRMMDERLKIMRAEKTSGVLCNFLGKIKVTCDMDHSFLDEL